ncbi:hypothetical protein GOP47_0030109 [Adiantum capillus-veneris]|nr:hypothetical protein GOP47_0030109 [Adiantum capillus-veneris]
MRNCLKFMAVTEHLECSRSYAIAMRRRLTTLTPKQEVCFFTVHVKNTFKFAVFFDISISRLESVAVLHCACSYSGFPKVEGTPSNPDQRNSISSGTKQGCDAGIAALMNCIKSEPKQGCPPGYEVDIQVNNNRRSLSPIIQDLTPYYEEQRPFKSSGGSSHSAIYRMILEEECIMRMQVDEEVLSEVFRDRPSPVETIPRDLKELFDEES